MFKSIQICMENLAKSIKWLLELIILGQFTYILQCYHITTVVTVFTITPIVNVGDCDDHWTPTTKISLIQAKKKYIFFSSLLHSFYPLQKKNPHLSHMHRKQYINTIIFGGFRVVRPPKCFLILGLRKTCCILKLLFSFHIIYYKLVSQTWKCNRQKALKNTPLFLIFSLSSKN